MLPVRAPFFLGSLRPRIMGSAVGPRCASWSTSSSGACCSSSSSTVRTVLPLASPFHFLQRSAEVTNATMPIMAVDKRVQRQLSAPKALYLSVRFASKKSSSAGHSKQSSQVGGVQVSSSTASIPSSLPSAAAAPHEPAPAAAAVLASPKNKKTAPSKSAAAPPAAHAATPSAALPTDDGAAAAPVPPTMPRVDVHHMSKQLPHTALPDILIVRTPQHAEDVARHILASVAAMNVKSAGQKSVSPVFAVDTETVGLNVKSKSKSSPVLWGQVLTMQAYAGPDFNFNPDPKGPACSKLFVDCAEHDLLHSMKNFFLSSHVQKVFHNYSFDHHVIMNCISPNARDIVHHIQTENFHGREATIVALRRQDFSIQGFAGDTMHMARLLEPSRMVEPATALERRLNEEAKTASGIAAAASLASSQSPPAAAAISDDALVELEGLNEEEESQREASMELGFMPGYSLEALARDFLRGHKDLMKKPMKQLFGLPKQKKDGGASKVIVTPATHELHGLGVALHEGWQERWQQWVMYGVIDAASTWHLYHKLKSALEAKAWKPDCAAFDYNASSMASKKSLMDVYNSYLVPFGQLLAHIESRGFEINVQFLKAQLEAAERDRDSHLQFFKSWLRGFIGEERGAADDFNVSSDLNRRALLFGPDEVSLSGARRYKSTGKPSIIGVLSGDGDAVSYLPGVGQEVVVSVHKSKEELQLERREIENQRIEWVASYESKLAAATEELAVHKRLHQTLLAASRDHQSLVAALGNMSVAQLQKIMKWSKGEKVDLFDEDSPSNPPAAAPAPVDDKDDTRRVLCSSVAQHIIDSKLSSQSIAVMLGAFQPFRPYCAVDYSKYKISELMVLARCQGFGEHSFVKTKADLVGMLIARQAPLPPRNIRISVHRDLRIPCLGLTPVSLTPTGFGQVNSVVLQAMVGKPDPSGCYTKGRAYAELLASGWHPAAAQQVTAALARVVALDACSTLIETFLRPLPEMVSPLNRIHCSLNINTETGRLSSRRPNLQNQPALEKDVYQIRKAFRASSGNTLIVADYGQLELRVLAHVSNCKSMIQAFIDGGDFHSRTAINMFAHVKDAVDKGEVLLEKGSGDNAHLPLLKDVFASERRKAKTLNFSIAYGKTAFGLAKDWGVTKEQAQDILELWYRDRPEVRAWQERVKADAMDGSLSEVYTLMGRTRSLPGIKESKFSKAFGAASRMAVNTPIQGGAADIVMCAMLRIESNERLKTLGFRQVLQVHDEIILEPFAQREMTRVQGPTESVAEAQAIVKDLMERPLPKPLLVDLTVDIKHADTWYEAK